MTAFGPFPGTVEVPFENLERGGEPFLLTGPTGSGKTTVLDGVCFALYGRVPRSGQSPDVVSRHRDPETTPSVELEFSIADQRLKVERIPAHTRPKKTGEGMTEAPHKVVVSRREGNDWVELATSVADADRELRQERLRMSESQFGQVVMLPQGDFARFLRSKPEDRKNLLRQLFPGEDLSDLQDWLDARAGEVRKERDELRNSLEVEIGKAWVEVTEAAEERGEEPPESLNHLDRTTLEESLARARGPLEKAANEARDGEDSARKARDSAREEKADLERRATLIQERGTKEDRLAHLLDGEAQIEQQRQEVRMAERAALVKPLITEAGSRAAAHAEALVRRDSLVHELEASPAIGTGAEAELSAKKDALNVTLVAVREFQDDGLTELQDLRKRLADLERISAELADPDSKRNASRSAASKRVDRAVEAVEQRKAALLEIRQARNLGMAAELAGELEPGTPCAVCGSTEHPSLAELPEGVERFEKRDEEDAEKAVADAEHERDEARTDLADVDREMERLRTQTEADLKSTGNSLDKAREAEEGLLEGEATIGARIDSLEEMIKTIGDCLEAIAKEKVARAESEQSAAQLNEALAAQGFETVEAAEEALVGGEDLARIKGDIAAYEADLTATSQRLEEPELASVDRNEVVEMGPATERARITETALTAAVERLTTLSNRLTNFDARAQEVPNLVEQLQPVEREAERVSGLADLAKGRNHLKVQLSNYVLAARLKQVIAAANRRLGPMSANRYLLVYEEPEGGAGQKGLGIRVFDAHTSDERGVETLSGGETFYASLSLALGLAEVVQMESGGRPIETLFIDEGFGTLDSGSLDQVMNEIENLRANGRTVGLVSHVEELRNRIQTQIQVTPSRDGSKLEIVGT